MKHQGSTKPKTGKCGARLRGKDAGRFCTDELVPGRTKCRAHGGATPREAALNATKHGAYAKPKGGAAVSEVLVAAFSGNERNLIERWRRNPEEALRLQLAEGAVVQRRALRAGAIEVYSRIGTMVATTARALVSLREVPPPEKALPAFVMVFEGKLAEDFEHDLEIVKRDAETSRALVVRP